MTYALLLVRSADADVQHQTLAITRQNWMLNWIDAWDAYRPISQSQKQILFIIYKLQRMSLKKFVFLMHLGETCTGKYRPIWNNADCLQPEASKQRWPEQKFELFKKLPRVTWKWLYMWYWRLDVLPEILHPLAQGGGNNIDIGKISGGKGIRQANNCTQDRTSILKDNANNNI